MRRTGNRPRCRARRPFHPGPSWAWAILLAALTAACEPPLTGATESLAIETVFRDLTEADACLETRFLARSDSGFSPLLETALRQRSVPLFRSRGAIDTGLVRVAVSPVRELDEALALEAATGRPTARGDTVRVRWTEWTYRLRCRPDACTIDARRGPRHSVDTLAGARIFAGDAARPERCRP